MNRLQWRPGGRLALVAILLAACAAGIVVAFSPINSEIGGRVAIAAVVLFALALAAGSARLVGLTTLVMATSALAATQSSDPAWVRTTVIGCIWYMAVELAWESIGRRHHRGRNEAVTMRRINEVATVVTIALIVAAGAFVLSSNAPQRTLLSQGPIMIGILVAMTVATRALADTSER